jgi:hypothetical protein
MFFRRFVQRTKRPLKQTGPAYFFIVTLAFGIQTGSEMDITVTAFTGTTRDVKLPEPKWVTIEHEAFKYVSHWVLQLNVPQIVDYF